jgi:hypothetical protein
VTLHAIPISLLLSVAGFWLLKRTTGRLRTLILVIHLAAIGVLVFLVGPLVVPRALSLAYASQPDSVEEVLFEGVTYIRDVRRTPRPLVIHVVEVDLDAPGIGFLVTPGEPTRGEQMRARTTSQFLDEFDLQVAVNGDFFKPWRDISLVDYYPHVGDPVHVLGFASSRGEVYSRGDPKYPTLYISEDGQAGFDEPAGAVFNAISGNYILVAGGKCNMDDLSHPYHLRLHPRTAIVLDKEGRTMMIFVIDGRQPNYSMGASTQELVEIVIEYGGYTALNLDGGGSTTLVVEGGTGEPRVLNAPIHNHVPYRERPVANHLGIYARALVD